MVPSLPVIGSNRRTCPGVRAGLAVRGGKERESVGADCTSFCSVAGEKPVDPSYSQSSKGL